METKKEIFEEELISRFFDPDSYFMLGFKNFFENIENLPKDPTDFVLIGLTTDSIINSENKLEAIKQLCKLQPMQGYKKRYLDKGVEYLKNSKLSTQQIMDMVGVMGI